MQRFTKYAIAPVLTLLASAASAEEGGFYLKIFGGASNLDDTSVSGAFAGDASFGSGFSTGAAFGYDYGTGPWRTELEFAYRTSDADTFAGGVTGDFASTSLMLNGYYDFASTGALTPCQVMASRAAPTTPRAGPSRRRPTPRGPRRMA